MSFLYELVFLEQKSSVPAKGHRYNRTDGPRRRGNGMPGSCNNSLAVFFLSYRALNIAENEYQTFPEGNPSRRKLKNVIKNDARSSVGGPVFPMAFPRGVRSKEQRVGDKSESRTRHE